MKKWPIFGSLIVLAAIVTMIALGVWQLQRADWKNGLLASYGEAVDQPSVAFPIDPKAENAPIFRKSSVNCLEVVVWRSTSGRSAAGQSGWAHIAQCRTSTANDQTAHIVTGWSKTPDDPAWTGGKVDGMIAPDSQNIIRLVASEPIPGLQKSMAPSTDDVPNNHLAYAVQWFLFAGIALIIFLLALRGRRVAMASSKDLPK